MTCKHVQNELAALLYGELSDDRRQAALNHLANCADCRAEWEGMQHTHALLDRLPEDVEGSRRLVDPARVRQSVIRRTERKRRRRRVAALVAGTAALLLVGFALADVRVEMHSTHLLVAWDEAPPDAAAVMPEPPDAQVPPAVSNRLDEQEQRLASVEELAQLAAQEVMAVDDRHSVELAQLRRKLNRLDRVRTRLATVERENDRRWKLIVDELSRRDAELAAVRANEGVEPRKTRNDTKAGGMR